MQVAAGLAMLEISATVMGRLSVIHPALIWDEHTAILVDTGYPGQLPLLREAVQSAGVPFETLTKVIITHQDLDHIGSLPDILSASAHPPEVLANELEKPFIQGERRPLKITPEAIARAVAALPAEMPESRRQAFKAALENPPKARVDRTVADGEELPDCGGIIVVDTPGHTPGHISLYHKQSKTLIAGDALTAAGGQLQGPNPQATLDLPLATRSLHKLARYDIAHVICYHGGLVQADANRRIAELAG